jgi:hypothetical protein
MSILFRTIRNRVEDLLLGTVGTTVTMERSRFKLCSQDTNPTTVHANDCERKFKVSIGGFEELEPWNSLCQEMLLKVKFNIKVSYQYTKGGMFDEETEGFETTQGNGDENAVNERAFTDGYDISRVIVYHENFGTLNQSPLVEVFSFHPSPDEKHGLELFSDRGVLTMYFEALVRTQAGVSYAGV